MGLLVLFLFAVSLQAGVLAPGVVSTPAHEGPFAVTPDGSTIYFTRFVAGMTEPAFFVSRKQDGRWNEARLAAMPEGMLPAPFSFSPDGTKLIYTHAKVDKGKARLWIAEREGDGWKNARPAGGALEKWDADLVSPSMTADGTLYFSSSPGGDGKWDIYRAALKDGEYAEPELLGGRRYERISSPRSETAVTVSADGKLVVLASSRSRNGQGGSDLFLAELPAHERFGAWTWTLAAANTPWDETIPQLSPDGKRLYFWRAGDIHEVELASVRPQPPEAAPWKRRAEMPGIRQWPQAAGIKGRIYVYGGRGQKGWAHEMDVYDPETDTWSPAGAGPEGWKEATLVPLGERLFLLRRGGPGVAEYRFDSKQWEVRPQTTEFALGTASPWATRTVVVGHKAYTMLQTGEFHGFFYLAEYDFDTGVWTPRRSPPPVAAQMAVFGGKIYAFGERTVVYDPAKNEWSDAGDVAVARFEAAPLTIGNEIWLIGGHGTRDEGILGDVTPDIVRFDPQSKQWREGPRLPWLRWGSAAVTVNGRLFVIGGIKPGPVWSADRSVFEYVPK